MAESGIYEIVNLVNGKRYVGSAVRISRRWAQHRHQLRAGRHFNRHLQSAWRKYGESNFRFSMVEWVHDAACLEAREQHHVDRLCPEYNKRSKVVGSNLGVKFGPEHGEKISELNRQRWADPEYRKRQSAAHKAYIFTDEHRAAISKATQGKKLSPEHLAKIRANAKSPDYRAKMSEAINRPEVIERNRKAARARWEDPDYRARVCEKLKGRVAPNKGVKMSAEWKAEQSGIM